MTPVDVWVCTFNVLKLKIIRMNDSMNPLPLLPLPTAPCLPDSVVATLDCNVNSFAVQWRANASNAGFYTAMAIGSDGTRNTCDSPNTNCSIQNLKCGLTYSVVVTTSSANCGTIKGSDYKIQSGSKRSRLLM